MFNVQDLRAFLKEFEDCTAEGAELETCSRQACPEQMPKGRQKRKEKYFLTSPNLAGFAPLREIF
jgi:hypothetical protein